MTKTRWIVVTVSVVFVTAVGLSSLHAQERQRTRHRTPPTRTAEANEVTLSGTLVDLQYYMSGKFLGKSPEACARNCIRRGVPAALETDDGLIILGMAKGTSAKLAALAMKPVEATGTLYEKRGLKYLAVTSVKKLQALDRESAQEEESEEDTEPEPEPDPDPPDEPNIP